MLARGRKRTFVLLLVLTGALALSGASGYLLFQEDWREQRVTLEVVSGGAAVQGRDGQAWQDASTRMTLGPGTRLAVKEQSKANLYFPDGSVTSIDGNSVLTVDYLAAWRQQYRLSLTLEQGRITNWVMPQSRRGYFISGTATTSSRADGAVFQANAEDNGASRFSILQGQVCIGAMAVTSEGRLALAAMSLSNGDWLEIPAIPAGATTAPFREPLRLVLDDISGGADRNVADRLAAEGIALQLAEPGTGSALYSLSATAERAVPGQLEVPHHQPTHAGAVDGVLARAPGLGTGYVPVLSVPAAPAIDTARRYITRSPPTAAPPGYVKSIYGATTPLGVAVDSVRQRIYVTESGGQRLVRVFDLEGKPVAALSPPNSTASTRMPVYVAVDLEGTVFVSDRLRNRIDTYSSNGAYRGAFQPEVIAVPGWNPLALAFDRRGNLYVTQTSPGRHSLLSFDPSGALRFETGKAGDGAGDFAFPNGIAVDDKGAIYVADSNNWRILAFTPDAGPAGVLAEAGKLLPAGLPRGLAIDSREVLYIVDALGHRVTAYQMAVHRLDTTPHPLFSFGGAGSGDTGFSYPNGIAVGSSGLIYVADRENNRVQVWGY